MVQKSGKLTSLYGKYPIIYRVLHIQTVVGPWDFWSINSRNDLVLTQLGWNHQLPLYPQNHEKIKVV